MKNHQRHENEPADSERDVCPPIFVVGVGRSGTTLLMAMLDAHRDITFPPETHFLRHFVVPNRAATRGEAARVLESDPFVQRVDLDVADVVSGFPEDHRARSWHEAYRRMLDLVKRRSGKRLVGDKDPKNIEYLPLIHTIYPDARILHTVRDPRDVLLSRKKADWSKHRPALLHLLAYRAQWAMGRTEGRRRFGEMYMEVQYERLISGPRETLEEVCGHLGVPYDPRMIEFHQSSERLVAADEAAWKKNVTKPLLTDNSGKWRKALTRSQVLLAESLCGGVFGPERPYARSIDRLRWDERLWIPLLRLVGSALDWAYQAKLQQRNRRSIGRLDG